MSLIGPSSSANSNQAQGKGKSSARKSETARVYAHPLPVLLSDENPQPSSRIRSILSFLGLSLNRISNPQCEGVFDPHTRSVWVSRSEDISVLWRCGFFGKGDLSRSEPSWYTRQLNIRKTGGERTSPSRFFHVKLSIPHPSFCATQKWPRKR